MRQDHVPDRLQPREAEGLGRLDLGPVHELEAGALDLGEVGAALSARPMTTACQDDSVMPTSGSAK